MEFFFYVSNLQKVFTGTRVTDLDLSKTQPCKYFVNMDQGNQSQEWRGTTQTAINCDTFWLQSFGTRSSANTKIYMFLCSFCFVLFCIWEQFPRTSPRGGRRGAYIWRGDLTEGFLWYEFEGLINIFGGLISGILRYTAEVSQKSLCY